MNYYENDLDYYLKRNFLFQLHKYLTINKVKLNERI